MNQKRILIGLFLLLVGGWIGLLTQQTKATANLQEVTMNCGESGATLDQWSNIWQQGNLAALRATAGFPDSPEQTTVLSRLQVSDIDKLTGSRIRTYLMIPESGDYTFWVAGNVDTELWLSSDLSDGNKTKIVDTTSVVRQDFDGRSENKSAVITLEAGAYYVEIVSYAAWAGGYIDVAWETPNSQREVIPASAFCNEEPTVGETATTPPESATIIVNQFTVSPETAQSGDSVTVSFDVQNASIIVINYTDADYKDVTTIRVSRDMQGSFETVIPTDNVTGASRFFLYASDGNGYVLEQVVVEHDAEEVAEPCGFFITQGAIEPNITVPSSEYLLGLALQFSDVNSWESADIEYIQDGVVVGTERIVSADATTQFPATFVSYTFANLAAGEHILELNVAINCDGPTLQGAYRSYSFANTVVGPN